MVGVGAPVTPRGIKEFVYKYDEHFDIHIYDTWGLEPSAQKAEDWKKTILKEIELHDKQEISDWFNTILFCLNAKSSRVEDFELDIMEKLLGEKNHLTIAVTHCRSKEDPDGMVLRDSIREEIEKRGIDTLEDSSFVFVSNVKKKLIGGSVEQFGKEEIFISIIRNVWASLKSKVPYQTRKRFEKKFQLKREELLKKPDRIKWIVPFMKMSMINRLEKEINRNCDEFVRDLTKDINDMYVNAVEYYSELSRKYAIIGFRMNPEDYETASKLHFDAMETVEEQVAADLRLLKRRMQFLNDILSNKKVESTLRDTVMNVKILLRDSKQIRQDLKRELDRYMEAVRQMLEEQLNEIEQNLNALEIDDLYTFQTKET